MPDEIAESLRLIFALVLVVVLFAACVSLPLVVMVRVHPAMGALVAVLAMITWVYLGPPPMPGFLNGFLALNGLFALIAIFVRCLIETVSLL